MPQGSNSVFGVCATSLVLAGLFMFVARATSHVVGFHFCFGDDLVAIGTLAERLTTTGTSEYGRDCTHPTTLSVTTFIIFRLLLLEVAPMIIVRYQWTTRALWLTRSRIRFSNGRLGVFISCCGC